LKLFKILSLSEACVDKNKKIIIKEYDDKELSSICIVTFPIKVGPTVLDTTFQVLDLEFPYNLLLD
jgi:hypothetical protein